MKTEEEKKDYVERTIRKHRATLRKLEDDRTTGAADRRQALRQRIEQLQNGTAFRVQ